MSNKAQQRKQIELSHQNVAVDVRSQSRHITNPSLPSPDTKELEGSPAIASNDSEDSKSNVHAIEGQAGMRDFMDSILAEQSESISRRSSVSSLDDDLPLLSEVLEHQRMPKLSPSTERKWHVSWSMGVIILQTLRAAWVFADKIFGLTSENRRKVNRKIKVNANRTEVLTEAQTGRPYVGNGIQSNRYTLWNFIPRQLFAQFSKVANFYFLCFALLQLVPGLSTIGNKTNIVPLMIFISISMAKEGYDDYRRYALDKKENKKIILVLDSVTSDGTVIWCKTEWSQLKVGNIIKLVCNEPTPADVVLLSSTRVGVYDDAYVETMALDGETNLKRKQVAVGVAEACNTPRALATCSVEYTVEGPNSDLYSFKGKVDIAGQTCILNDINIIYRGSTLRNTPDMIAMIVYAGEECKIRMNANSNGLARVKAPRLQSMLNRVIAFVVSLVIGLTTYNTIAHQIWKSEMESKLFYLSSAFVPLHHEIFGFVIMFATMIPLSLYISMEIIKLSQVYFLNVDVEMYDEIADVPFEARTSTINEDLGQITHIFSDKTGTLTANEMEFRRLYVAGTQWVHRNDVSRSWGLNTKSNSAKTGKPSEKRGEALKDTRELLKSMERSPDSILTCQAKMMFLCMALCHTCVPTPSKDGEVLDYQASSPDEVALVRSAKELGYCVRSRDTSTVTLELSSTQNVVVQTEIYEILGVIEFTNDRKRMSIIVRFPDGRICIICKGADSVILERLASSTNELESRELFGIIEQDYNSVTKTMDATSGSKRWSEIQSCLESVQSFANDGLRTLLYAYRFIDATEYDSWKKVWDAAKSELEDDNKKIETVESLIEIKLKLAGATAVEDNLQKGAPESIDKLRRANIKIWMLTGDKLETAINIGRSCRLIQPNSTIIALISGAVEEMRSLMKIEISRMGSSSHNVVVLNGDALTTICDGSSGNLEPLFFELVARANSVICCRAQPSQKAQLVRGVRTRVSGSVTLAIGDGANDVAMIQEAHVGIGIMGKEGSQAARCSDYSFAQFRFLQRLILVHGRWNYIRTCKYILGTLSKEIIFFLPQALFQRWNGFTGTSFYEPWSLTQFNTLFTSLPVMAIGIFEKDLSASTLLAVPELYQTAGQGDRGLNVWVYVGWTVLAVIESMIVYFLMLQSFAGSEIRKDDTIFPMSDLDFVAVVIIVSMKMQIIEMHDKSMTAAVSIFLCVGAAFLWNIILAATYPLDSPYKARGGFFDGFGKDLTWWITLIFIIVCVYVLEVTVILVRKLILPTQTDLFQELERNNAQMDRFEEARFLDSSVGLPGYSDEPIVLRGEASIELQDIK